MKDLLAKILQGHTLTFDEATKLLGYLTDEEQDPVAMGAALAALRTRGETAEEVRAFAVGLQDLAVRPDIDVSRAVDVVGTGGDQSGSLNLSTGSALLAAAAGAEIVKHGNRSVSSKSGSFDVLAELGLDLPWDAQKASAVFEECGFTYLFAPTFHPAMKTVAPVRQSMGARTIFNIVGPLANPARVRHLVVGAFSPEAAEMMAKTLSGMDIARAYVVHGEPGWDEPTPVGPYILHTVTPNAIETTVEDPKQFGLQRCEAEDLLGGDPSHNASEIRAVFSGQHGPHRDALILGAALALRVVGAQVDEAVTRVERALDDGSAGDLLIKLAKATEVAGV